MNGALTGIVLVLLWATVLFRLPTLWRDARQRAMGATLFALALAKTVAAPRKEPAEYAKLTAAHGTGREGTRPGGSQV